MIEYYWSRQPGKFVDKTNGKQTTGATFTGTVREWYETLIEVMIDVALSASSELRERPLRYLSWRGDSSIVTIVECSVLYKPDGKPEIGTVGKSSSGLIVDIPIRSLENFFRSGILELVQFEGSSAERVIGRVTVDDIVPHV